MIHSTSYRCLVANMTSLQRSPSGCHTFQRQLRTHYTTFVANDIVILWTDKFRVEVQLQIGGRSILGFVLHLDHVRPGVLHLRELHLLAMLAE